MSVALCHRPPVPSPSRSAGPSLSRKGRGALCYPSPLVGEGCAALASSQNELRRSWVRGRAVVAPA